MSKLRLGIVGLGMAVTPHALALHDLREIIDVVYAFSPSLERRTAFSVKSGFPVCDRVDAILDDPSIDAVLVLTPPNTHLEIVTLCANAGKHVLLEKPLDVSTSRAKALVSICQRAGIHLGIVLQHRFKAAAIKLSSILDTGDLGQIIGCSATIPLLRPQSYYDEPGRGTLSRDGGGVLITQGIHTLNLMLSYVGPAAEVSSYVSTTPIHQMEGEDLVCAALKFRNQTIGTIYATTSAYPGFPERIELLCQNGTASIVGNSVKSYWHDGRELIWESTEMAGGTGADPMAFSHGSHRAVIADFVDSIQNDHPPKVTGEDVLHVHRLIDAIIMSGRTGLPTSVEDE